MATVPRVTPWGRGCLLNRTPPPPSKKLTSDLVLTPNPSIPSYSGYFRFLFGEVFIATFQNTLTFFKPRKWTLTLGSVVAAYVLGYFSVSGAHVGIAHAPSSFLSIGRSTSLSQSSSCWSSLSQSSSCWSRFSILGFFNTAIKSFESLNWSDSVKQSRGENYSVGTFTANPKCPLQFSCWFHVLCVKF